MTIKKIRVIIFFFTKRVIIYRHPLTHLTSRPSCPHITKHGICVLCRIEIREKKFTSNKILTHII